MRPALIPKAEYEQFFQLVPCATQRQVKVYFTGDETRRHKRTEVIPPRMAKKRELVAVYYEGVLVYLALKNCKGIHWFDRIPHDLGVTEGLVRFLRADMSGMVLPEREFRGLGSVPEWGIVYDRSLLLYEFCTLDNVQRRKVESKVLQYRKSLSDIERRFNRRAVVVFVIEARRSIAKELAMRTGEEPFYFTDYITFLSVAIGEQLTAPIYFWSDGEPYALRNGQEDI